MNYKLIEDAVRNWVLAASGLPNGQVYFGNQNGPEPSIFPYMTIIVGTDVEVIGTVDELTRATNLANPAGTEITQTTTGIRNVYVTIQCIAQGVVNYNVPLNPYTQPTGTRTAVDHLMALQTALGRESVRDALLNTAGLVVRDSGTIRRTDGMVETYIEGRAILEITFQTADQQTESTGYITEVSGTGTETDGSQVRTNPFDIKWP